MKIDFYKTDLDIGKDRLGFIDQNEIVNRLEVDFAKYIGKEHAIAATNSSNAFHLALCALDIKRGDKILCSINIHPSVPSMIRQFDAEPIFIDIEEDGANIDFGSLKNILENSKGIKLVGIIISFIGGAIPKLEEFYKIMKKHKELFIIEDATEALGAKYKNKRVGSFDADITVFSFFSNYEKSVCGAMLITNNKELSKSIKLKQNYDIKIYKSGDLNYIYDIFGVGCDYALSGVSALCCSEKMKKIDDDNLKIKNIAKKYSKAFKNTPHITVPNISGNVVSVYNLKIDKNRDDFAKTLLKNGIETKLHYIPMHMMKYYRSRYELKVLDFPNALKAYQHILAIPLYPDLKEEEVNYVIENVNKIAKNREW